MTPEQEFIEKYNLHLCELCDKIFASKAKLNRHQANIHDIGVVWHYCDIEECNYKCKDKYNLKKHKAHIHDIGVKWNYCPVEGCNEKFKISSDLRRHTRGVHEIDTNWHYCDIDGCNEKFNTTTNLKRHKQTVHNIDTVWYFCDHCDFKAKAKADIKNHTFRLHNPDIELIQCDIEGCDKKFKLRQDLVKHKKFVHNPNAIWYKCTEENCRFETKYKNNYNEHLAYLHDLGDKKCDYCLNLRYTLTVFEEAATKNKVKLCRTCLRKVTGRDSRIEITMSNYLDKHFGTEYLLASDNYIKGEKCQRYRPDKLYASPGVVLHIGCDEKQHSYTNGSYHCDEQRISALYDEFPGNKYIVIRWNPDKYKCPENKTKITLQKDKLKMLLMCIEKVMEKPPEQMIFIIYMFYDQDNKLLSKNIPHCLIYDKDDIDKL